MTGKSTGPVLIEIEDDVQVASPATAPPVPEPAEAAPTGQAIQTLAVLASRKPSRIWRLFWSALIALAGLALSLNAWDFLFSLLGRNLWLGRATAVVLALFVFSALILALREWLAFARLNKISGLKQKAEGLRKSKDAAPVQKYVNQLVSFYSSRAELSWAIQSLKDRRDDLVDPDALLDVTERELMTPLDAAARREIEAASRQVATITAIVPLALADVATALFANLRMVRRVAEIYGGRGGTLGSFRLLRTVLVHLVATGAVSVGDDLIGSLAGGGLVSKFSRRFGEGVINGALTARVGIAAMEVCRPMPFSAVKRPGVAGLVKRALAGLFLKQKN